MAVTHPGTNTHNCSFLVVHPHNTRRRTLTVAVTHPGTNAHNCSFLVMHIPRGKVFVKTATKKLHFGTKKCIKMHIGNSENDALCKDLHVGGWKVDVIDGAVTGKPQIKEYFFGNEKMEMKKELTFLV